MSTEEIEKKAPTVEVPTTEPQTAEPEEDDDRVPEEEVTTVEGWAPSVTLEVKENVTTGEEEEECLFTQRSKLLRYAST
jgi:Ran-binding protein 1